MIETISTPDLFLFVQLIVLDLADFGGDSWHELEVEFEEPKAFFRIGDVVFLAQFRVFGPLVVYHQ